MVDIVVQRGAGDRDGGLIESPLLSETYLAVLRGRAEIDRNAEVRPVSIQSLPLAGARPGRLVEVRDALQGPAWRGKITHVRISQTGLVPEVQLTLARPVDE